MRGDRSGRSGAVRNSLACSLGLMTGLSPAVAQERPRPDIVVEGQRPDEPALDKLTTDIVDTPQAISVVSEGELEQRGVTTLTDALRVVPGISLGAGETSWQGNNLVLRGFTTRNDTFADGIRDYGYYFRDPFNSESVEVLKGPSSTLFGRGATGGVINQVSKSPTREAFVSGDLIAGTDETVRATMDINQPLGGTAALRLNTMAHRSEVADRDGALNRRWGVAPSLALGLGTPTRLTLSYLHQEENNRPDYGIPWFAGAPARVDRESFYGFADDDLDTNVDVLTARLVHDASEALQLRAKLRYSHNERAFRTSEAVVPPGTPVTTPLDQIRVTRNEFSGFSKDAFLQAQADFTYRFATGSVEHALVAGVELGRESPEPTYIFHVGVIGTSLLDPPPQTFQQQSQYVRLRAQTRADSIGVFALDTITLSPEWLLIGGLRWDSFSADYQSTGFTPAGAVAATTDLERTDRNLSARGSLVYKPSATSSVYVSYADSFNPSAEGIESLISSGRSVGQANVDADPEQGRIIEAGAKWNLGDQLLVSGSVFEIVKSDVRVPDPFLANANTNGGRQRVRGFELEAVGRPVPELFVRANYAFLDTETTETDNPTAGGSPRIGEALTVAPRHSGTVQIDYAVTDRFSLGGGVLHQSSRLGQNTNASLLRAPGYTLFDARARYAVTDEVSVQLNVLNIGDTLYYDQLHPWHVVPGAGRSALISLHFTS